jgi:hypothetical protein
MQGKIKDTRMRVHQRIIPKFVTAMVVTSFTITTWGQGADQPLFAAVDMAPTVLTTKGSPYPYLLADPNTGEVFSPDEDQMKDVGFKAALANLNTPKLKRERLDADREMARPRHFSPKELAEIEALRSLPGSIANPLPVFEDVPSPGSQAEVDAVVGAIIESLGVAASGHDPLVPPNIVWNNKITGANRSWTVSGTSVNAVTPLPSCQSDSGMGGRAWKMVGIADMDRDGQGDIIWEDPTSTAHRVWFMATINGVPTIKGSPMSLVACADIGYRVVGAGDFNNDGYGDLLWQHQQYATDPKPWIWFGPFTSTNMNYNCALTPPADNWRIVGATGTNPYATGTLLWRNQVTGEHYLWFLNQCVNVSSEPLVNSTGSWVINKDQDFRIVGYCDLNGDGSPDVLLRHSTMGRNGVWYLARSTMTLGSYGTDKAFHEFNTNWRVCSQDLSDSTWPLDQTVLSSSTLNLATATVLTSALKVQLAFNLDPDGVNFDLQRSDDGGAWTTIQTLGAQGATAPVDATVINGHSYEWRLLATRFGSPVNTSRSAFAALSAPPSTSRGKILLLVDNDLRTNTPTSKLNLDSAVQQLTYDLIGDGWGVVGPQYVPRHKDQGPNDPHDLNMNNLTSTLGIVRTTFSANADLKGVLIVGHVTVPYSGDAAADGHTDTNDFSHIGAWPADTMYGFTTPGIWDTGTQDTTIDSAGYYPANWNFNSDGKYDRTKVPANLQLFVGRIDFARLPSFNTTNKSTDAESALIKAYVNKASKYRKKIAPFPVEDRGIVESAFGSFTLDDVRNPVAYRGIKYLMESAFPTGSINYSVADPLYRTAANYTGIESSSALWGFLGGPGLAGCISAGVDFLQHNTQDLAASVTQPSLEPRVAFHSLFGSYFMDWNMEDDFLRATIATPNYGVAAIIADKVSPNIGFWNYGPFECGLPLGSVLLATAAGGAPSTDTMDRMFAIMGDPTLRIHTLRRVENLTATVGGGTTTLSWAAPTGEGPGPFLYYVLRAPSLGGSFSNLTPSGISTLSYPDSSSGNGSGAQYMVRVAQLRNTGRGSSYTNLSQAAFWPTLQGDL